MNYKIPLIIAAIVAVVFFIKKSNINGDRFKKTVGVFILSFVVAYVGIYLYENNNNDNIDVAMSEIDPGEPGF